jgi:hypothetical protein
MTCWALNLVYNLIWGEREQDPPTLVFFHMYVCMYNVSFNDVICLHLLMTSDAFSNRIMNSSLREDHRDFVFFCGSFNTCC